LTVNNDHTYFVGLDGVLGYNAGCDLSKFYDSIRYQPDYPTQFSKIRNGTRKVNVKNSGLLNELNKMGRD